MDTAPDRLVASTVTVPEVSPAELYEVLVGATSQDPALLRESDKRLKQMMGLFGAFDALHDIASQKALPVPVRKQAIIQFKNEALKSWRSRKVQNDQHRQRIRNRCLTFLDDEDETIAIFNNVIASKLARQDYPSSWPNLVTDLIAIMNSSLQRRYNPPSEDLKDTLILQRSLHLLNLILGEFAAHKMLTGVRTMSELVDQLHATLYGYYSSISSNFTALNLEAINSPRSYNDILIAHRVYKCISKIAGWLWQRSDRTGKEQFTKKEAWFQQFFQNSAVQLQVLLDLRYKIVTSGSVNTHQSFKFIETLTTHIRHIGKFFRRLSQLSHARFVELPLCGNLVMFYWSLVVQATTRESGLIEDSPTAVYPVRILVQGMALFNENLAQWAPKRRDGTLNKNALSKEFVENAVTLIVGRFLPLNLKDLESWIANPEEWVNIDEKESEQWEFEIRPCSERILMHLSNQFADYVMPLLETAFKQVASQSTNDMQAIVQKEALYCAIGRCVLKLKAYIHFEQWAAESLVVEARSSDPNFRIIKRRIAWMIGQWVSQACVSPNLSILWDILVHLLSDRGPGSDMVVRFTAATAVRECVDTLEFDVNVFAPYIPTTITELVKLMGEADTLTGKTRIGNTLNVVIDQAGSRITPFVATITEPLSKLWSDAGADWSFKGSLLTSVTNLVKALKGDSTSLGHIIVPLVRASLREAINLDEDGLGLWKAALHNTLTVQSINGAPALLDLVPDAIKLLATNLDLLGKTVDIIESYMLLEGAQILQVCAVDLFKAFRQGFENVNITVNRKDLLVALNLIVSITPSSLWGEALHVSGLFAYLMKILLDGEIVTYILAEHIYIWARIVMADRQMFLQLMTATVPVLGMTEAKLYERLMDVWWDKFDSMSEPKHRKLCAMGMAALVSTGRHEVLERLPTEIFNLWSEVFLDLKESKEQMASAEPLRRYWEFDDTSSDTFYKDTTGTPEHDRRKLVNEADPVRTIKLTEYVGAYLREAEALYGAESFRAQYISKADPIILQEIEKALAEGL
ncbi:ARM repeat-containing protein [Guyanagaster necrorhizus]|uniref:ARM repeat-containing protein n=1 Tax=Guyanagaster necrorhizus TaxID=856835 RepID=A0A9P7W0C6_9AGAR|nr:ARM repeat-containing protein [Guyanagaster necrorhizus MCA 3950]KAG7449051.1 ARM repeat-containing protein [Guyanagaster necrorhizus MCA 3950]